MWWRGQSALSMAEKALLLAVFDHPPWNYGIVFIVWLGTLL
jgi:hypothetical protein